MFLKKSSSKGFSLVELSIVLVILGLLVIGIFGGQALVKQGRIKSALTKTSSSIVNQIDGLSVWLELTDPNNLIYTASTGKVSSWRSRTNGQESSLTESIAFIQPGSSNQPVYVTESPNGYAAIKFTGMSQYMYSRSMNVAEVSRRSNDSGTAADETTVFLVKRYDNLSNTDWSFYWAQSTASRIAVLVDSGAVSYEIANSPTSHSFGITSAFINKTHVMALRRNSSNQSTYYLDGSIVGTANQSSQLLSQTQNGSMYIGEGELGWMYELIVFRRGLTDEEVNQVNSYLMSKFSIKP